MENLQIGIIVASILLVIFIVMTKSKDSFVEAELNPWSPEEPDTSMLDSTNSSGSYNDIITDRLPPEISASHREYTSDSNFLATSGSSRQTEYDHDQSFLPWVAGGRRGGAIHSGSLAEARTTTSYTEEQEMSASVQNSKGISWG